jgi:hypothetical protein
VFAFLRLGNVFPEDSVTAFQNIVPLLLFERSRRQVGLGSGVFRGVFMSQSAREVDTMSETNAKHGERSSYGGE